MRFITIAVLMLALSQPGLAEEVSPSSDALKVTPDDEKPVILPEIWSLEEPIVVVQEAAPDCPLPAPTGSSVYEIEAWNQICASSEFSDYGEAPGRDAIPEDENDGVRIVSELSEAFLVRILTQPDYVAARPSPLVQFSGVDFLDLDLHDRFVPGSIIIVDSTNVSIDLDNARIEGSFGVIDSEVSRFSANNVTIQREFTAWLTSFKNDLTLAGATIGHDVNFHSSKVEGEINAFSVTTGRGFFFEDGQAEHLNLRRANIAGSLDFSGTSFAYTKETDENGVIQAYGDGPEGSVYLYLGNIGGNLDARGSNIFGRFSAADIVVNGDIWLADEALIGEVDLQDASIAGDLVMDTATVNGRFGAENLSVAGSVWMREGASFEEVRLPFAKIGNNLETSSSTFTGHFRLNDAEVGGNVWMNRGAKFNEITLTSSWIDGSLSFDDSTVSGELRARNIRTGYDIYLTDGTFRQSVTLSAAKIGGLFQLDGSTFLGDVLAEGIQVQGNAFLRNGSSFGNVILTGSNIGQMVQLQGSRFNGELSLANVTTGTLLFWRGPSRNGTRPAQNAVWGPNASLNLRNARADALQAQMGGTVNAPDSWVLDDGSHRTVPRDLTGFRYDLLGGFTSDTENDLARVDDPDALVEWVNASRMPEMTGYRPQPYHALEAALRNMGAQAAANEVAYARMKHRADTRVSASFASEPWTWIKQVGVLIADRLFQWAVGFGVYPHYAFGWFIVLVVIGAILARPCLENCAGQAKKATVSDRVFYSLENAIPLMEPSADFAGAGSDNPWIRFYFNFAKVSGFALATVIIGVLTFGA